MKTTYSCLLKPRKAIEKRIDYNSFIGTKKDRLIVQSIEFKRYGANNECFLTCKCDCGKVRNYRYSMFVKKDKVACVTCIRTEAADCGKKSTTDMYSVRFSMIDRCYNQNHKAYVDYGGRGIRVCERWLNSLEDFILDMGERPSKDYSIDRIDNDGDYETSNCRWATKAEQAENRRSTQLKTQTCIEIFNKNKRGFSYSGIASQYNVSYWVVARAVKRARKELSRPCKLSWTKLQKMYYNAMWAADMWTPINTDEALRYWKIANRISQALWNFKPLNVEVV